MLSGGFSKTNCFGAVGIFIPNHPLDLFKEKTGVVSGEELEREELHFFPHGINLNSVKQVEENPLKIGFGVIYLIFVAVGVIYELVINKFTEIAIVNYVLTGFLYASGVYIAFFIIAKMVLFVLKQEK